MRCRGAKLPTLKGTEESLSYVECFLYLVSSSINVSIFHIVWLDTFWTDLVYLVPEKLRLLISQLQISLLCKKSLQDGPK